MSVEQLRAQMLARAGAVLDGPLTHRHHPALRATSDSEGNVFLHFAPEGSGLVVKIGKGIAVEGTTLETAKDAGDLLARAFNVARGHEEAVVLDRWNESGEQWLKGLKEMSK